MATLRDAPLRPDNVAFARRMREAGPLVPISRRQAGGLEVIDRPAAEGVAPTTSPSTSRNGHATAAKKTTGTIKSRLPQAFVIAGNGARPAVIDLENWGRRRHQGEWSGQGVHHKLKTGFGTGGRQLSRALKWCSARATKPIIADGSIRTMATSPRASDSAPAWS